MSATGKTTKVGSSKRLTQVWYPLAGHLGIMNSCDLNLDDLFWHEFHQSSVPQDDGNMPPLTSNLNWIIVLELSSHCEHCHIPMSSCLMDVPYCGLFTRIRKDGWFCPYNGGLSTKRIDYINVYPVFDRYHPYSPKSSTWIRRSS